MTNPEDSELVERAKAILAEAVGCPVESESEMDLGDKDQVFTDDAIKAVAAALQADNARLIARGAELREAAADALSGWRYIRQHHGDLSGVGWDRVEHGLVEALNGGSHDPS